MHAAVAVLSLFGGERALTRAWQVLALSSLLVLLGLSGVVLSSALYLSELYRGIGPAIGAGLFVLWALFAVFTVPVALWGLLVTPRPRWFTLGRARRSGAGALVLLGLGSFGGARAARAEVIPGPTPELSRVAARFSTGKLDAQESLGHQRPARCREPVDASRLTLLVTSIGHDGRAFVACLQAESAPALTKVFEAWLSEHVRPGAPLKLDRVSAVQALKRSFPALDALKLRPALDGVCGGGRCLAPWQLVARDSFTRYRPLEAVRDATFGCSFDDLASALDAGLPEDKPLLRIETESLIASEGKILPVTRFKPVKGREATLDELALARQRAETHLVNAQERSGTFRYLMDPFSGEERDAPVNLPRQAGTTLVLCELAQSGRARKAVRRALDALAQYEQTDGDRSALVVSGTRASLGASALPLIAFASCRKVSGRKHDRLIGGLARLLLAMQREDGSFYADFELERGKPSRARHTPLYAAGQAIFALTLVEQLANEDGSGPFPERSRIRRAVERAMNYTAHDYWPRPLRPLFYLEENWHCLAARAALGAHRNPAYERFCLDYVAFKSRLILEGGKGSDPELVGGYSLSPMLPPHNTPTAGFGEALAAAIAVKQAQGLPVERERALMRRVLEFLGRQQWTPENCFACAPGQEAIGGFSESSASPLIRIDYVQHALAALGHGLHALGYEGRPAE